MDIKDLTPEQRERALACKTSEELFSLAKEYGVELTDEQLEGISGGGDWNCYCDEPAGFTCNSNCADDAW